MSRSVRLSVFLVAALFALVLSACGADATATPTATATPPQSADPSATPDANDDFQAEWDALIEAAQEEGELVWVAGGTAGRTYRPIADLFSEKFDIDVTFSTGSGTQQTARVLAEQAAGKYDVDILMIGETSAQQLLEADGIIDLNPLLIHPDAIDGSKWYGGHLWFTDPQQKYQINTGGSAVPENLSMRYNTNLVTQEDIDSWDSIFDFLDPKWKGKIVALPPTTGGAGGSYYNILANPNYDGEAFLRQLFDPELDVFFTDDFRTLSEGVARGQFAFGILIGAGANDIDALGAEGAPVAQLIKPLAEGYTLTGAGSGSQLSIASNAPNPKAAQLFLNWWLTQEGQTARHQLSESIVDPSLRTDVVCAGAPATTEEECREDGVNYVYLTADPELTAKREELNQKAIDLYLEIHGE